jgi:hypothetical protein
VEDEEEEGGGEEAAGEQNISTQIRTHEWALTCISEVMQFAIDPNSSSLLELLYTVKDCIQKDIPQKSGNKFLCWMYGRNLNELYIGNMQCAV